MPNVLTQELLSLEQARLDLDSPIAYAPQPKTGEPTIGQIKQSVYKFSQQQELASTYNLKDSIPDQIEEERSSLFMQQLNQALTSLSLALSSINAKAVSHNAELTEKDRKISQQVPQLGEEVIIKIIAADQLFPLTSADEIHKRKNNLEIIKSNIEKILYFLNSKAKLEDKIRCLLSSELNFNVCGPGIKTGLEKTCIEIYREESLANTLASYRQVIIQREASKLAEEVNIVPAGNRIHTLNYVNNIAAEKGWVKKIADQFANWKLSEFEDEAAAEEFKEKFGKEFQEEYAKNAITEVMVFIEAEIYSIFEKYGIRIGEVIEDANNVLQAINEIEGFLHKYLALGIDKDQMALAYEVFDLAEDWAYAINFSAISKIKAFSLIALSGEGYLKIEDENISQFGKDDPFRLDDENPIELQPVSIGRIVYFFEIAGQQIRFCNQDDTPRTEEQKNYVLVRDEIIEAKAFWNVLRSSEAQANSPQYLEFLKKISIGDDKEAQSALICSLCDEEYQIAFPEILLENVLNGLYNTSRGDQTNETTASAIKGRQEFALEIALSLVHKYPGDENIAIKTLCAVKLASTTTTLRYKGRTTNALTIVMQSLMQHPTNDTIIEIALTAAKNASPDSWDTMLHNPYKENEQITMTSLAMQLLLYDYYDNKKIAEIAVIAAKNASPDSWDTMLHNPSKKDDFVFSVVEQITMAEMVMHRLYNEPENKEKNSVAFEAAKNASPDFWNAELQNPCNEYELITMAILAIQMLYDQYDNAGKKAEIAVIAAKNASPDSWSVKFDNLYEKDGQITMAEFVMQGLYNEPENKEKNSIALEAAKNVSTDFWNIIFPNPYKKDPQFTMADMVIHLLYDDPKNKEKAEIAVIAANNASADLWSVKLMNPYKMDEQINMANLAIQILYDYYDNKEIAEIAVIAAKNASPDSWNVKFQNPYKKEPIIMAEMVMHLLFSDPDNKEKNSIALKAANNASADFWNVKFENPYKKEPITYAARTIQLLYNNPNNEEIAKMAVLAAKNTTADIWEEKIEYLHDDPQFTMANLAMQLLCDDPGNKEKASIALEAAKNASPYSWNVKSMAIIAMQLLCDDPKNKEKASIALEAAKNASHYSWNVKFQNPYKMDEQITMANLAIQMLYDYYDNKEIAEIAVIAANNASADFWNNETIAAGEEAKINAFLFAFAMLHIYPGNQSIADIALVAARKADYPLWHNEIRLTEESELTPFGIALELQRKHPQIAEIAIAANKAIDLRQSRMGEPMTRKMTSEGNENLENETAVKYSGGIFKDQTPGPAAAKLILKIQKKIVGHRN